MRALLFPVPERWVKRNAKKGHGQAVLFSRNEGEETLTNIICCLSAMYVSLDDWNEKRDSCNENKSVPSHVKINYFIFYQESFQIT